MEEKELQRALPVGTILKSPKFDYRIEAVLGQGGFGITYKVSTTVMFDKVPIFTYFTIKEHFMKDACERDASGGVGYSKPLQSRVEESRGDFLAEARRLNEISGKNPNVVPVSEVFEANNTVYYVMEYLNGGTLRDLVKANGALSEQAALDIEDGLDTLRYNKVIVATDADVDGMHIRLLIITFFLQFFPDLIKKGHVYVLQTPLFRVRNRRTKIKNKTVVADADARLTGKEKKSDFITRYCYSEDERQQAIRDLGPDPEITRFKGLGEISPEEFAHFIGPEMRLEQVTLHKTDQVQKLLEYYMGKNTMERQNFIIDNLVVEEDLPEEDME